MSLSSTFTWPEPTQVLSYVPRSVSTVLLQASTSSAVNPHTTPLPTLNDHQWITTYLTIHRLSTPSYRYAYILWLAVVFVFLMFAALHWSGARGGAIGALWSKWSLRRRTWRKEYSLAAARRRGKPHKQPLSLPSNAQLLSLAGLYIVTLLLCFLGPDYIAPDIHVWDLTHSSARTVPSSTASTTSQPVYTISKAWWTAGGRTGTIAFALFPLCVLFALKSPPFALFALPFLVQIYNDKLAFLHRWTGRLIWFVTTLHIALWGVQLSRDKRSTDNPSSVWSFAFEYDKFVSGWLGYICLTLLVALSFRPIRTEFYEVFYILHVLLVPLTLAFSALHFPDFGWWCWAAVAIWVAERLWRLVRFLRTNGIVGGSHSHRSKRYIALVDKVSGANHLGALREHRNYKPAHFRDQSDASQESHRQLIFPSEMDAVDVTEDRGFESQHESFDTRDNLVISFPTGTLREFKDPVFPTSSRSGGNFPPHRFDPGSASSSHILSPSQPRTLGNTLRATYIPPPGYAHCTLLPGRTIRLRLVPSRHFSWAPGQYALLNIPSVSKFSSHPFTIASICDNEASSDEERAVVILVRARTGFTKNLWSHIERLQGTGEVGDLPPYQFSPPRVGVLLRAYLDGPFGSSIRARWTSHSSVLIIAGGSGVSFAVAVLEYACMCMAGRNGKMLGGLVGSWGHDSVSQISRVRFVWVVREFCHIQWVATVIRKCTEMVSTSSLQVDIFVTNVVSKDVPPPLVPPPIQGEGDTLSPPVPRFAQSSNKRYSTASDISMDSIISSNTSVDVSYMNTPKMESGTRNEVMDIVDMYGEFGEEHELDFTNFDGEDDSRLPGETELSYRLRKEGKVRRAKTRKLQRASLSGMEHEHTSYEARSSPQPHQEFLAPISGHSGSRLMAPSLDVVGSPHSPLTDELHSPWSPGGSLPSPSTSHTHPPQSFLYPGPGDSSKNSSKPEVIRPHDSKRPGHRASPSRKPTTFEMDEAEAEDTSIVAERARPGRAKLDRIIAHEAGRSRGAMVVACCGPTSLNAMVRKNVAAQISPSRIFRGDQRASITLVSEDFEW